MECNHRGSSIGGRKAILILSASQYLVGHPISEVVKSDWEKEKARGIRENFENEGFNIDPDDMPGTLETLQRTLQNRSWDGVIVGWCVRGDVEFTVLFEKIVDVITRQLILQPELKVMFCAGPDDLVQTTVRNFPT